jgi:hypothetical protein
MRENFALLKVQQEIYGTFLAKLNNKDFIFRSAKRILHHCQNFFLEKLWRKKRRAYYLCLIWIYKNLNYLSCYVGDNIFIEVYALKLRVFNIY